jgi:polyisoprenoid-binding protein YceI
MMEARMSLLALPLLALAAIDAPRTHPGSSEAEHAPPAPMPWTVDASHTEINFSVRHFFTPVTGTFRTFEISLEYDPENPAASRVRVSVDVASVDTRNERRDNHLRSADFFDAQTYPRMTFESTSVRAAGPNQLVARGNLTIRSTTREVELPITVQGIKGLPPEMQQMFGGLKQVASFTAQTQIDRRDFGVGVGNWAEVAVVGAPVEISVSLEANRK